MATHKPPHRMTLLELLVHTEKHGTNLHDTFKSSLWPVLAEYRDLSRPVRKRSSYPTMLTMQNTLNALLTATQEMDQSVQNLTTWMEDILRMAKRQQSR